jgi:hypothetical protein
MAILNYTTGVPRHSSGVGVAVVDDSRPPDAGERKLLRDCGYGDEQDATEAQAAYDRAQAWARSVAGTPYGSTTPTLNRETNR